MNESKRVSWRPGGDVSQMVTVEANGLSLVLLPDEDPGVIFAEAEAVIDEKDARPGLGLEPDAAWTPEEGDYGYAA